MKTPENMSNSLFELIQSDKAINDFDNEEVRLIQEEIGSIDAFDNLRNLSMRISREMKSESEDLKLNPNIFLNLKAEIGNNEKKSSYGKMINYKIPAYQAVAACIALFFIFSIFVKQKSVEIIKDKIEYITKTEYQIIRDTIIQTPIAKKDIQINEKSGIFASVGESIDSIAEIASPEISNNKGIKNLELLDSQRKGVSISDDTMAMKCAFTTSSRN